MSDYHPLLSRPTTLYLDVKQRTKRSFVGSAKRKNQATVCSVIIGYMIEKINELFHVGVTGDDFRVLQVPEKPDDERQKQAKLHKESQRIICTANILFASSYDLFQFVLYMQLSVRGNLALESDLNKLDTASYFAEDLPPQPSPEHNDAYRVCSFADILRKRRRSSPTRLVPIQKPTIAIIIDIESNDWIVDGEEDIKNGFSSNLIDRIVQFAWIAIRVDDGERLVSSCACLRPDGFTIAEKAVRLHGITQARALTEGRDRNEVLKSFMSVVSELKQRSKLMLVAHNLAFDKRILEKELLFLGESRDLGLAGLVDREVDTMDPMYIRIMHPQEFANRRFGATLLDTYRYICGEDASLRNHDAGNDAEMCSQIFLSLVQIGLIILE